MRLSSKNPAEFCLSLEHDNSTFFPITKTPTHPLAFTALCNDLLSSACPLPPSITIENISMPIASGFALAIATIPGLKPRGYSLSSLPGFCLCPEPVKVTFHPISPSPVRPLVNASEQHSRGYKAEHCNQVNHPLSYSPSHSLIHSFIQLLIHSLSHSPEAAF
jgi:hypothetical protein